MNSHKAGFVNIYATHNCNSHPDCEATDFICEIGPGARNEGTEHEANSRLIAEAGTVANKTGLTPRQLADDRAALLEALKLLLYGAEQVQKQGVVQPQLNGGVILARSAIAKASHDETNQAN